jgi:ABC-type multidrug transport system fused ATPase/permease subunit
LFTAAQVSFPELAKAKATVQNILAVIDRESQVDAHPTSLQLGLLPEDGLQGNIHFIDVRFSYPSRPESLVLKGFNISCRAGTAPDSLFIIWPH